MDCFYINLDAQTQRRDALERNFNAKKADGWRLSRFRAVDTADVGRMGVKGNASPSEKACFLSHKTLIRENIASGRPMMIMEDDAIFGDQTCGVVDQGLRNFGEQGWDILFTDVCVPSVGFWPDFVRFKRQFSVSGEIKLVDLSRVQFAGATCYILNEHSKINLLSHLEGINSIDFGYDMYLRNLTYQAKLRSMVFVPFVTSLSALSEGSSIQQIDDGAPERIWDLFRRMVWMEGDLSAHAHAVESIRGTYGTEESRMFGPLFEAMLSDKLRSK